MNKYLLMYSYSIKEIIKDLGGKFDEKRRGWIWDEESLNTLRARAKSGLWGMALAKGFHKCKITQIEGAENATA